MTEMAKSNYCVCSGVNCSKVMDCAISSYNCENCVMHQCIDYSTTGSGFISADTCNERYVCGDLSIGYPLFVEKEGSDQADTLPVHELPPASVEDVVQNVNGKENSPIKDSGERTAFDTGAVRDMHTGKGRMDLLPLTAVIELSKHCEDGAIKYGEHNVDKGIPQHSLCDSAMRHLAKYMRGDQDENHIRAAAWNIMWALEQSVTRPELNDLLWAKETP